MHVSGYVRLLTARLKSDSGEDRIAALRTSHDDLTEISFR